MATISTRLTNAGTLLVNGTIDEVTFNTTAGNATIYNQFSNSQVYGGTNWVLSSTSITPNVAIAPDGSNTATMLMALNAYPTLTDGARGNPKFTVNGGDVWTVSGYVKYGNLQYMNIVNEYVSGTGWYTGGTSSRYNLINGTVTKGANVTAAGMISVGNNWWRMYSTYTIPAGVTGWNPQIYRMGQYDGTNYAGNVVYVWGAQLEKNANVSTYQPIESSNILLTPTFTTRTVPDTVYVTGNFDEVTFSNTNPTIKNLLQYTEQFDINASWIKTRSNIGATNAVVAPDGTLTADKLIEDTTATQTHYINSPSSVSYVTSSSLPVASIYVKAGERTSCGLTIVRDAGTAFASGTFNVDLSTGTVLSGSGNIADAGNGWYRISTPATTFGANYAFRLLLNQSGTTNNYTGDGTSGLYIWGAQLEPGNIATIYQGKGASTILTPKFARREDQTGNMYVTNSYDEFTGAPVVDGNIKLWLDAGQTASYPGTGTTWTDLSTNQLNGTLVNTPTFSSNPANILFNGTSQRVTFTSNTAVQFLNTAPYTLEAWVYPTQIPPAQTYQGLIDRENNPGTGRDGWNLWLAGNSQSSTTSVTFGAERFGLGVQSGASISVTAVSTIGVWQHMVATYDGTTIRVYRNGVQITSAVSSINITNTTQTVGLASRSGAGSFLYGSISAAKIYDRALSADEVAQNFNALRRRYNI